MAPRWFKNVNFDRILSQIPAQHYDGADKIREKLAQLDFPSFNSTGPIITEVESDNDENHVPERTLAIHSSSAKSNLDQVFADYSGLPAPERPDSPSSVLSEASTRSSVSARSSASTRSSATTRSSVSANSSVLSDVESSLAKNLSYPNNSLGNRSRHQSTLIESTHARSIELFLNDLQDEISIEVQSVEKPTRRPSTKSVGSRVSQSSCDTEGSVVEDASHLRRSKRKRWAPLDFARGERPIYKRAGPTFEFAGIEKGFPEKYSYGRRRNPVAIQKPRKPSNAVTLKPIEFKKAKRGDYLFHNVTHNSLITGVISLEPNQLKPESRTSATNVYLFFVRSGEVLFKFSNDKSTQSYVANSRTDWIVIKPGYRYFMRNVGTKKAEIAYIVSDRVEG